MPLLTHLRIWPLLAYERVRGEIADRGDVPGWVMIAIMTAGIVGVIGVLARNQLGTLFTNALNSVAGGSGG